MELTTIGGEDLVIDVQVHVYAHDYLLVGHPLVSPIVSYQRASASIRNRERGVP